MNDHTKLVYALEHVAHLEDLIEDNEWKSFLIQPLTTMKFELERQLHNEKSKRGLLEPLLS